MNVDSFDVKICLKLFPVYRGLFETEPTLVNCSPFSLSLQLEPAKKLVRDAIAAGIFNDLGSGSYVDLCVITKEGVDYIRPYDKANLKGQRSVSLSISLLHLCRYPSWKGSRSSYKGAL